MSDQGSPASEESGSSDRDASMEDEALFESQAVFKGPDFLRRWLRFPEFDADENEE